MFTSARVNRHAAAEFLSVAAEAAKPGAQQATGAARPVPAQHTGANLGSHPGDNAALSALTVSYGSHADGAGTWKPFSGVLELLKVLEEHT
jgi:hypothetical protein